MRKKNIIILPALLLIIACNEHKRKSDESTTYPVTENNLYFLKADKTRDSVIIEIKVNGDRIIGKMLDLPYEKDSKIGLLEGTKSKDGKLNLLFTYYQEGEKNKDSIKALMNHDDLTIYDIHNIYESTKDRTPLDPTTLNRTDKSNINDYTSEIIDKIKN